MNKYHRFLHGQIERYEETLDKLKEQQDYKCFYCDTKLDFSIKQSVHLDHVVPLCKDGKHTLSNVVWSCASCNLKKGGK